MRQAATLFIFGFALLLIFFIYLAKSLAVVQRVAVVDAIVGEAEVRVHGEGDPAPLEVGKLVRAGDIVQTGADSSVELRWVRWAGGMRIRIGPSTRFAVTRAVVNRSSEEKESRVRVEEGTIWIRLREALTGKSKFEVETPTAVAAVRGTVFRVTVARDGSSTVSVWEGMVVVSGGRGQEVVVGGGSMVALGVGEGEIAQRALSAEESEAWLAQTSIIGPFLFVEVPEEGATVEGGSCVVSGRTEPGVKVFVNEAPAAVSEKGEFSATVELSEGQYLIWVRARGTEGVETTVVREVSQAGADAAGE
ncbi:MAG TPA: FecR domain-containing protein [Armatimonadota bacterium]|nr:FecR domain-containing protein [Armatimonadota bacterium]